MTRRFCLSAVCQWRLRSASRRCACCCWPVPDYAALQECYLLVKSCLVRNALQLPCV